MDTPNVKIIIKGMSDGHMAFNVKSENKVKASDVLQMLSVAIATTVANTVPKDLPEEERDLYIGKAAEIISEGIKNDFFYHHEPQKCCGHCTFRQRGRFHERGSRLMTGQKERACPCANTNKPIMENILQEYTMDSSRLQYVGVLYFATDGCGRNFKASTVLRMDDPQLGDLIHWLHYHLKGSNPPPALYHLEMLLQNLEYLRGGRQYLYNSIYDIQRLEPYP